MQPNDFVLLEIPARIADLALRIAIPRDWQSHELPTEEVDFSAPGSFFPLLVATAPWAAVALTVAARPGFEDGTLQDWSLYLLDSQGIRPTAFSPTAIGNVKGLAGVGSQQQQDTALEVRFAFFEDGGRLVHFGLLAPAAISASLESVWRTALESFVLERPQGQSVPVGEGMGIMPAARAPEVAAAAVEPAAAGESNAPVPPAAPLEVDSPSAPEPARFTDEDLGFYAKSNDLATLDPEHPINARLRDQGVGFVHNLLDANLEAKTARLGASAIQAVISVALGWHVNDDGKRTLLLDPDGKIQISLQLIATQGRTIDEILDALQFEACRSYANPEFLRLENDGISALAVRNILVDNERVEQVHMLKAWAKKSAMVRARVTADPASTRFAVDYADLILKSADYGNLEDEEPEPPPPQPQLATDVDGPDWWRRAVQLEREDRLEEAERLLRDSIPSLHCAIQIAEMYRLRWIQLKEKGESAKAEDARQRAADWARTYASWATSGGEGAALSVQRDDFLRQLGIKP